MARRRHGKRRHSLRLVYVIITVAIILVSIPFIMSPMYRLSSSSLVTCLVPDTKLTLILNEINDTLGAKNLVIIYTLCGATSCDRISKTITVPIQELRSKPRTIDIGRGTLDNILIELKTRETIPATRVSAVEHGSALLFTWAYPALRAVLYVGLESRRALLSIKLENMTLTQYKPPHGCSLEPYRYGSQVYSLTCSNNIYSKHLVFSRRYKLLRVERIIVNDYYCPGNGIVKEYLDLSAILWALGLALLVLGILRAKIRSRS